MAKKQSVREILAEAFSRIKAEHGIDVGEVRVIEETRYNDDPSLFSTPGPLRPPKIIRHYRITGNAE